MLSSILHTIKTEIAEYALGNDGEGKNINVQFVSPANHEETLYPEAINIALFGSNQEKDIRGNATFNVPTTGNLGLAQKPPLKLSIDLLLLFNFNKYATALAYYEQVIGFFYNNDVLQVSFDGYANNVEVLLSEFSDRNEIEIWNSFNTPGIPMLRYFFRYALISGKVKQLPIVRDVSVDTSKKSIKDIVIDPMVLSFIYQPTESIIQGVVQKTTTFCSINLTDSASDTQLQASFDALLESYTTAFSQVQALRASFEEEIAQDPSAKKTFEAFIPSLHGMEIVLTTYQEELANFSANVSGKYKDICVLAKSNVSGKNRSLDLIFLEKLTSATAYLGINTSIEEQLLAFTTVGDSAYSGLGAPPYSSFQENPTLSQLQLQKKWWELENLLNQLEACYSLQIENPLLAKEGEVYTQFLALLEKCKTQIKAPLEMFEDLNESYNNRNTELTEKIKDAYLEAYTKAYEASHYVNELAIPTVLAEGLQEILIEQNT